MPFGRDAAPWPESQPPPGWHRSGQAKCGGPVFVRRSAGITYRRPNIFSISAFESFNTVGRP